MIVPDWPAPRRVRALMSTRQGGVSQAPFDSLNLRPPDLPGESLDQPPAVLENQRRFGQALGAEPVWLDQVHGHAVRRVSHGELSTGPVLPRADASITTEPGLACTVLVADCLPVLLCSRDGRGVGAAHAGWRGLAGGVLDNTVLALCEATAATPDGLLAWLGPCIGPQAFEVGPDVLLAFGVEPAMRDLPRFRFAPRDDGQWRWRADLVGLARDRLGRLGVSSVLGGHWCTVSDPSRFYSFRRDGRTGRMAAGICLLAD
jgi:YfiH family protein